MTKDELIIQNLEDMHHRLFGNGQPGEIGSLKARVSALERRFWIALGVVAGIGLAAGDGTISLKALLEILR